MEGSFSQSSEIKIAILAGNLLKPIRIMVPTIYGSRRNADIAFRYIYRWLPLPHLSRRSFPGRILRSFLPGRFYKGP